jgi:hypothetical protein
MRAGKNQNSRVAVDKICEDQYTNSRRIVKNLTIP